MFSDILPHDMGPIPDNSKEIKDAMNLHKFYWDKIEGLNKSMEDLRQCYWNEVNDLKKELQEKNDDLNQMRFLVTVKDNHIKVLTESYNQALEVIKKCKYK